MPNLLIGITGSVASIKLPLLIEEVKKQIKDVKIKIVTTEAAKSFIKDYTSTVDEALFFKPKIIESSHDLIHLYDDGFEWRSWNKVSDPVVHIELRRWADIFLIAPLDANTLGKIANGLCDNLLTCILRAWDTTDPKKKVIAAPAMNTLMWNHPFTAKHLEIVTDQLGFEIIPPIAKILACGDQGMGAMASVETLVTIVNAFNANLIAEN